MPTSKHGTSLRQQLAGLQPAIKLKKKNKKMDCHHPAVIPDRHVTALHCACHMSHVKSSSLFAPDASQMSPSMKKENKSTVHARRPYTCCPQPSCRPTTLAQLPWRCITRSFKHRDLIWMRMMRKKILRVNTHTSKMGLFLAL